MKRLLLVALASSAFAVANAATITFTPSSQTVNAGQTATVDVEVSGLTTGQIITAFDLFVTDNSSVVTPESVTFFTNLGTDLSFSGSTIASGQVEAYEVSNDDNTTLATLETTEPFSLFSVTYLAVGPGTSPVNLDLTASSANLVDGNNNILTPTVTQGSITVRGTASVTPEPSTFVLLGTGGLALLSSMRRRRVA